MSQQENVAGILTVVLLVAFCAGVLFQPWILRLAQLYGHKILFVVFALSGTFGVIVFWLILNVLRSIR